MPFLITRLCKVIQTPIILDVKKIKPNNKILINRDRNFNKMIANNMNRYIFDQYNILQ